MSLLTGQILMSPKSYGVYRIFKKRDNTMGFFKKDPLKKVKILSTKRINWTIRIHIKLNY